MTVSAPEPALFARWLQATKLLQEEAYGLDYSSLRNDPELVEYIRTMYIATVQEMGELLDETSWKPWAKDEPFVHRPLVIKEAVDALHFIANILCAVGASDEDLSNVYEDKMRVNRERQARPGGYRIRGEHAEKCRNCRRALDDVAPSATDPTLCSICAPALETVSEGHNPDLLRAQSANVFIDPDDVADADD